MTIIKWKDFEVHHLIVIRGEMDEELKKKQTSKVICFWIFQYFLGKRCKNLMLTPIPSQTTTFAPPTQKKIGTLLEHVVGNLGALIATFQESIDILKNMDKNFVALIAKL